MPDIRPASDDRARRRVMTGHSAKRVGFGCLAMIVQVLACGGALACDGQVGKVIYEDTFADDSGGWDMTAGVTTIKPPNFVITLDSKSTGVGSEVLTFHATEGDICSEFVLPKSIAADNKFGFGIIFWAADYNSYWLAMLSSDGSIGLYSRANNTWQTVVTVPNAPGFKADADAINALRVTTIGGKISMYLNGQLVKAIRAEIPDGVLKFGMHAQIDKGADTIAPVLVKSFKVTSGQ
jgi:hypothetical protein